MKTLKTTVFAAGLAGLLAPATAAIGQAVEDYSQIPPEPAKRAMQLKDAGITLAEASELAAEEMGGQVKSAEFKFPAGGDPTIEALVYTENSSHRVTIDPASGEVISSETLPGFEMPGWEVKGEWTETDSGLKYYDVEEGDGEEVPNENVQVRVHYTGWLVDGEKFDSSRDRGQPATFPLNRVIPGWTEGVKSMKVGGKRKLLVPYELAYGERGRPPVIPGKAMLIFDVELLEVMEQQQQPQRPRRPRGGRGGGGRGGGE